jgi:hypothetical protein
MAPSTIPTTVPSTDKGIPRCRGLCCCPGKRSGCPAQSPSGRRAEDRRRRQSRQRLSTGHRRRLPPVRQGSGWVAWAGVPRLPRLAGLLAIAAAREEAVSVWADPEPEPSGCCARVVRVGQPGVKQSGVGYVARKKGKRTAPRVGRWGWSKSAGSGGTGTEPQHNPLGPEQRVCHRLPRRSSLQVARCSLPGRGPIRGRLLT